VGWEGLLIRLRFYYDGEVSEEDLEAAQIAATEVNADLPDDFRVEEEILRRDAPEPLESLQEWVYERRE
jgi:hypothetical protein